MMNDTQIRNKRVKAEERGFSLIELLIVVAIILIIAAIAIPNLLKSRMAANEAAAAENLRTITTASVIYNSTYGNGFPPSLPTLGAIAGSPATCDAADLIDPILTAVPSQKSGYSFIYTGQNGTIPNKPITCGMAGYNGYLAAAVPIAVGITGQRSFCSDTPGVIHFDTTGNAIPTPAACDALQPMQ
jgi:type IV pilus assembly protein PilA